MYLCKLHQLIDNARYVHMQAEREEVYNGHERDVYTPSGPRYLAVYRVLIPAVLVLSSPSSPFFFPPPIRPFYDLAGPYPLPLLMNSGHSGRKGTFTGFLYEP